MTCKVLTQYLEQKSGNQYELMYYITAERNIDAIFHRKGFYGILEKNGFSCDIRNFKGKQVMCPNKECKLSKNGFTLQMQEQVDVAIVMKAMELAYK